MKLAITVITYNRSGCLKQVLDVLSGSMLCNYHITVFDNCSADDTVAVAESFYGNLPNLKVISNKINIGGDANMMRAAELSEGEYTWVLCDDDVIDLSHFDKVLEVIEKGEVDLLHVGAHPDEHWERFAGVTTTPRKLVAQGYPYFKFSSFLPCNIFRTALFQKDMIKAYRNIVNSFPLMPYLINEFEQDKLMHVSKNQIVTATLGSSNYALGNFYYWWMGTSKLLKNKAEVRLAFLDQWRNIDRVHRISGLDILNYLLAEGEDKKAAKEFIRDYLTPEDRLYMFKKRFMGGAYYKIIEQLTLGKKSIIRTIRGEKRGSNPLAG